MNEYGVSFPATIAQMMRNMEEHPPRVLELWLPKNMPAHYEAAASALVEQGVAVHRTDGKVYRKSDIVRRDGTFDGVWVDEAPEVGTIGWTIQNRLNWATLLLCHHCKLKRDIFFRRQHEPVDSYIQNA